MESDTKRSQIVKFMLIFCVYAFGPVFIATTNPDNLPLVLLIVPFLWLFLVLFLSTMYILRYRTSATKRQVIMVSSLVASLIGLLAVFQSIHQLSIRDVLLSLGIVGLAALYMLRADFIK